MPVAKPRARQSLIRSRFSSGVAMMAPVMPVRMTSTAVRVGDPPIPSEMPIATGAVTDFGASDSSTSARTPKAQPMPSALRIAVVEPATSATAIGTSVLRTDFRLE
jgi:hypothetical protein